MSYNSQTLYERGLKQVRDTPEPKGQKFPAGARVKIADDLGETMVGFVSGKMATVEYTYAHAFGGDDVKSYSLNIDGVGSSAWYYEHQLTLIDGNDGDEPIKF